MDDHFAKTVQYTLAIAIGLILILAGIWDGYMYWRNQSSLTVSRIVRTWMRDETILVVFASFLFYHLVVERLP